MASVSLFIIDFHADTTDVQRVEAIFYENRLYLRCSFATNSVASGCLIKFLLKDSNETEDFEINREKGYSCNTTKNQFGAYSGFVVLDIEASGSKGNTSLPVFPMNVSTLDEYEQETGCKGDTDICAFLLSNDYHGNFL